MERKPCTRTEGCYKDNGKFRKEIWIILRSCGDGEDEGRPERNPTGKSNRRQPMTGWFWLLCQFNFAVYLFIPLLLDLVSFHAPYGEEGKKNPQSRKLCQANKFWTCLLLIHQTSLLSTSCSCSCSSKIIVHSEDPELFEKDYISL